MWKDRRKSIENGRVRKGKWEGEIEGRRLNEGEGNRSKRGRNMIENDRERK